MRALTGCLPLCGQSDSQTHQDTHVHVEIAALRQNQKLRDQDQDKKVYQLASGAPHLTKGTKASYESA